MLLRSALISLFALVLVACASGPNRGYRSYDDGYARCQSCGTVERIEEVRGERSASGGGAILGGIVGGVIGNQIGSGDGRRAATGVGAIGGAVAGHQIEKNRNAAPTYDLFIRMDDGRRIVVNQRDIAGIREGSYIDLRGSTAVPLR